MKQEADEREIHCLYQKGVINIFGNCPACGKKVRAKLSMGTEPQKYSCTCGFPIYDTETPLIPKTNWPLASYRWRQGFATEDSPIHSGWLCTKEERNQCVNNPHRTTCIQTGEKLNKNPCRMVRIITYVEEIGAQNKKE